MLTDEHRDDLKNNAGAARDLLEAMEKLAKGSFPAGEKKQIDSAATNFRNQWQQMNYGYFQCKGLPIGSCVTEAACKTLVKHRLCASGIRWKEHGAVIVLSLRALVLDRQPVGAILYQD